MRHALTFSLRRKRIVTRPANPQYGKKDTRTRQLELPTVHVQIADEKKMGFGNVSVEYGPLFALVCVAKSGHDKAKARYTTAQSQRLRSRPHLTSVSVTG